MKVTQQIMVAGLCLSTGLIILSGCSRRQTAGAVVGPGAPKIEGDRIMFSPNAPQLGYLTIEPAQERKALATGLNGRLAWDETM
jgi:hypothetical protein